MNRRALLITISAFMLLTSGYSDAETTYYGAVETNIPNIIEVQAIANDKNNTVINAKTGTHDGLRADFHIRTNGDDKVYDFIISSKVIIDGVEQNSYFQGKDGSTYVMLANIDKEPTMQAYNDIVSGNLASNPNIIAYPVSHTSLLTINPTTYNDEWCFQFLSDGSQNMDLSQNIGITPLNRSYSIAEDSSGTYRTVVTLNVYPKLQ